MEMRRSIDDVIRCDEKKIAPFVCSSFVFLSGQIFASLHFVIMINEDFEAKMEDSSEGWSINVRHGWG